MSQAEKITYAFFVLLLVSPVIPLVIAWTRFFKRAHTQIPRLPFLTLVILSCSCALVLTSMFFEHAIGPSYSMLRFGIIGANWLLAFLGIVAAALQKGDRLNIPMVVAAGLLLLIWSLSAALNSVV